MHRGRLRLYYLDGLCFLTTTGNKCDDAIIKQYKSLTHKQYHVVILSAFLQGIQMRSFYRICLGIYENAND